MFSLEVINAINKEGGVFGATRTTTRLKGHVECVNGLRHGGDYCDCDNRIPNQAELHNARVRDASAKCTCAAGTASPGLGHTLQCDRARPVVGDDAEGCGVDSIGALDEYQGQEAAGAIEYTQSSIEYRCQDLRDRLIELGLNEDAAEREVAKLKKW